MYNMQAGRKLGGGSGRLRRRLQLKLFYLPASGEVDGGYEG